MIFAIPIRVLLLAFAFQGSEVSAPNSLPVHKVDLIADHNSIFRLIGDKKSELDLIAGEPVLLRVEARKAKSMNRDGSIHGLLLLDGHRKAVPGWDLLFKPGVQEMQLTAPVEAGVYEAVCTVICSSDHEQMKFRVVVSPK